MAEIGYTLSCEEFAPARLVQLAQRAEETGFTFATISDHFHPWIDRQGHSPFVWAVIGGVAQVTTRLRLGTGVTCPTVRYHPAIVAQAAATCAAMLPGRFFLGVGSGENLNEHIVSDRWPPAALRLEMLEEAVSVIRLLWQGGVRSHRGQHYTVHEARLYTLPAELPPIVVAASGPHAAELAGRIGDGLMATSPQKEVVDAFHGTGGTRKPRYGQLTVCWATDEVAARQAAHEAWPNAGLAGPLSQELRTPAMFEQAAQMVTEEKIAEEIVCGPDPERHLAAIREYIDAGFDHISIHQVGPEQEGFFRFYQREVLPRLRP